MIAFYLLAFAMLLCAGYVLWTMGVESGVKRQPVRKSTDTEPDCNACSFYVETLFSRVREKS